MQKIRLGKTELMVTKPAMGCLPVQRRSIDEGAALIRAAYEGGINYFDTANAYSDSEAKIGLALADVRNEVVISTKSAATDRDTAMRHIENSLTVMKTDYIDLFQFHNVKAVPDPDDASGAFAAALEAKAQGMIRHIGVTTHRITIAEACIEAGHFETLQFPFSYISSDRDLDLARKCKEKDMGYIAMKGLAGGLLTNAAACTAFMNQYDNVVPIWGMQHKWELDQWLAAAENASGITPELAEVIRKDRAELAGSFCRSCGYCLPCPANIEIFNLARLNMLLRRSPWQQYYTPEFRAKVEKIDDCIGCRSCASRCPYGLDTPNLIKFMQKDYYEFYEAHKDEL